VLGDVGNDKASFITYIGLDLVFRFYESFKLEICSTFFILLNFLGLYCRCLCSDRNNQNSHVKKKSMRRVSTFTFTSTLPLLCLIHASNFKVLHSLAYTQSDYENRTIPLIFNNDHQDNLLKKTYETRFNWEQYIVARTKFNTNTHPSGIPIHKYNFKANQISLQATVNKIYTYAGILIIKM